MRKVLSFALVLSLVLGSFGMAFATTSNTVQKIPTVATDAQMPVTVLELKVGDSAGLAATQKIKLSLENGEFYVGDNIDVDTTNAVTKGAVANVSVGNSSVTTANAIWVAGTSNNIATATAISASDKSVEFELTMANAGTDMPKDSVIYLALNIKSDLAGEVKVKVDGLDSQISSGTYTVGVAGGENTIASVSGDPKQTGRATAVKGANIEIREVAVNSVSHNPQNVKLTLPKGIEWDSAMHGAPATYIKGDMVSSITSATVSPDGRDLTIVFVPKVDQNNRQVLTVEPLINVTRDARLGDIEVQVRNMGQSDDSISDASGLLIAKYTEDGVTVTTIKEADLPEIVAGREFKDNGNNRYTVEVTLEEVQDKSLISNKYVDFTFPEWVQIATGTGVEVKTNGGSKTTSGFTDAAANYGENRSNFEYEIPAALSNNGKADKLVFTIPVTVEADKSGDIELTVNGPKAGVSEAKIVVGKIVAPITAEVKVTDLRTGIQNQAGGEIIIKENVAGALRDYTNNNKVQVWIDNNGQKFGFSKANAEVLKGDLEIKEAKDKGITKTLSSSLGDGIEFTIDRSSIKTPAEIKISGIQITLDRTPAEGKYDVNIGGNSVVDNAQYNDADFTDATVATNYINVVTPADQGVNATFTIDSKTYTVNGGERTMEATPYIDAQNRTMMPIRYVADALGVSENQINWDQATQTATIFGKSTVVVKMGAKSLSVNGAVVPMDTVSVNKNGNIYIPVRFVANALGANVGWDQATKVITLYTVGK